MRQDEKMNRMEEKERDEGHGTFGSSSLLMALQRDLDIDLVHLRLWFRRKWNRKEARDIYREDGVKDGPRNQW